MAASKPRDPHEAAAKPVSADPALRVATPAAGSPHGAPSPARALQARIEAGLAASPAHRRLSPAARMATIAGLALASWCLFGAVAYGLAMLIR